MTRVMVHTQERLLTSISVHEFATEMGALHYKCQEIKRIGL